MYRLTFLFFVIVFGTSSINAKELSLKQTVIETGRDVMEVVYAQAKKHPAQTIDVKMSILNNENKERKRFFTLLKYHQDSTSKSLIKFYMPANIKGSKLLTHSLGDNETNQWLYIPAFKTIRQILSDDKNNSFMGSDFSFSDIAGRLLDQDSHDLVKQDDNYFYITSTPVDKNDIFEKLNIIIDRKTYVILKIDFYKNGSIYKKLLNGNIQNYGNMYIATQSVMHNLKSGGKSTMYINEFDYASEIEETQLEIKSLY